MPPRNVLGNLDDPTEAELLIDLVGRSLQVYKISPLQTVITGDKTPKEKDTVQRGDENAMLFINR